MKLYYSPGACSLSPHIVFREAGLPVTLVKASTKTHKLDDGTDFYTLNPKGYVPLLELDNGEFLSEGPAIVQYLADQNPGADAHPPPARWHALACTNGSTSSLRNCTNNSVRRFRPTRPPNTRRLKDKISKRFDWLAGELKGKDYLMGSQFTVADAYLYTILRWSHFIGLDLAKWPVLAAYKARVEARPKVHEALVAEGLVKAPATAAA